jgi:hypothetical protein
LRRALRQFIATFCVTIRAIKGHTNIMNLNLAHWMANLSVTLSALAAATRKMTKVRIAHLAASLLFLGCAQVTQAAERTVIPAVSELTLVSLTPISAHIRESDMATFTVKTRAPADCRLSFHPKLIPVVGRIVPDRGTALLTCSQWGNTSVEVKGDLVTPDGTAGLEPDKQEWTRDHSEFMAVVSKGTVSVPDVKVDFVDRLSLPKSAKQ